MILQYVLEMTDGDSRFFNQIGEQDDDDDDSLLLNLLEKLSLFQNLTIVPNEPSLRIL